MKTIIKKILMIYISLVLIFAPSSVFAASAGGWAFNSFNVATSVVTAFKNGASASVAVAKSPITSKIAKGIVGGAIVGAAIPLAISQISGIALTAVDWVLDPANNTIKYKDKTAPAVITGTKYHFYQDYNNLKLYDTPQAACNAADLVAYYPHMAGFASSGGVVWTGTKCVLDPNNFKWEGYRIEPVSVNIPNDYKTIPIPTVSDKIYDNAKTDTASASIVNDAVRDYVNEGSADTALDAAKADADATHNCGTGTHWSGSACVADTPSTPSTPTTPDTPFDPSSIIDAIGKVFDAVMSLPDVINSALDDLLADIKGFFEPVIDSVTDFFDAIITKFDDFVAWVKQEPPQDEAPKNVPVGQLSDVELENFDRYQKRIYFAPLCPTTTFSLTVLGVTIVKPVDFTGFCAALEQVTPFLVASTYIACAVFVIREI